MGKCAACSARTPKRSCPSFPEAYGGVGLQDAQAAGDNDTTAAAVQEVGARNTKYVGQKVQVAMRNADSTSQKN